LFQRGTASIHSGVPARRGNSPVKDQLKDQSAIRTVEKGVTGRFDVKARLLGTVVSNHIDAGDGDRFSPQVGVAPSGSCVNRPIKDNMHRYPFLSVGH
jgi:hypothetical protein